MSVFNGLVHKVGLFRLVGALNVDSEARAYRIAAQKRAGGTFLGRGPYMCKHWRGERAALIPRGSE